MVLPAGERVGAGGGLGEDHKGAGAVPWRAVKEEDDEPEEAGVRRAEGVR